MDRVVLCMKWGNLYGSDYVNVLFNATHRNLAGPFRFVCLTDNVAGLAAGIETYPIPEIGCSSAMWQSGAWPKLSVFSADLYGLTGRALFIDLDTLICGDLGRFFDHPAPFVAIDTGPDWRPGRKPGGPDALLGTGVFAFDLGSQVHILNRFRNNPEAAFAEFDIEQVWVQHHASSLDYWPEGWVISFKRWLRRPVGLDLFLPPKAPKSGTGIVAFHGNPRPIALLRSDGGRWDRFPHMGSGQVAWMRDYWVAHGGTLPAVRDGIG